MSEHLTIRQEKRLEAYELLCDELAGSREWRVLGALENATAGLLQYRDLTVMEYASAVAGMFENRAPDGHWCGHATEEFAAHALSCPSHDARGECRECPF